MLKFNKKLIIGIILFLLVLIISAGVYFYLELILPNSASNKQVNFTIESGQTVSQVGKKLQQSGLIKNRFVFQWYVMLRGWERDIKSGEYSIAQNLSIKKVVSLLRMGQVKKEIKIKIIEGWTINDIAEYFDHNNIVAKDKFLAVTTNNAEFIANNLKKYPFLSELLIRNNTQVLPSLEGYLFPDTYAVYIDATTEEIVKKMLDNFQSKLSPDLLAEIEKQGKSLDEVIVLASIIEKEVSTYEDRRLVADVFLKRLKIGMPLQSDATVNYITKKGTTRSSYEDLAVESAYNTYQNKGLPPGPISNPSLSAIKAVIYPLSNDYYYFLTDKDGNVYYGRNGDEHNLNRQKYLN